MCGFNGAISFGKPIEDYLGGLNVGLNKIAHRGPDSSGSLTYENVFLGHNRLSIIDVSNIADQPLKHKIHPVWIVYNGEIYNYLELKNNLLHKADFYTHSDTEVILNGYLEEGIDFFKKLRGIYAFCILDARVNPTLILGRDPSGIKPLYYYSDKDLFCFGSEIKAILPVIGQRLTVNESVIKAYLNLSYCPEPYTVYNEIRAFEPGTSILVRDYNWTQSTFAKFDFSSINNFDYEANVKKSDSLISNAISRNLVADVDINVALSGGIDSSLTYAYSQRESSNIKGLTVKFTDDEYDESKVARAFASSLNGNHEIIEIENDFNLDTLNRLLLHFDQPYADSSAIPVYYLTKATHRFSKVLLGGDGGDEIFNGYPSSVRIHYLQQIKSNPVFSGLIKALLFVLIQITSGEPKRKLTRSKRVFDASLNQMLFDLKSWLPRNTVFNGKSPFNYDSDAGFNLYRKVFEYAEPQNVDGKIIFDIYCKTLLSDYLRKTDMMSMLNGVEYRVPFLDEDLVQFALTVPFTQKSGIRITKKILRDLHKEIYPPELSNLKKKGFSIPLDKYLDVKTRNTMYDTLLAKDSYIRNFIDTDYIKMLFEGLNKKNDISAEVSRDSINQRILMFYSLEIWHLNRSANI